MRQSETKAESSQDLKIGQLCLQRLELSRTLSTTRKEAEKSRALRRQIARIGQKVESLALARVLALEYSLSRMDEHKVLCVLLAQLHRTSGSKPLRGMDLLEAVFSNGEEAIRQRGLLFRKGSLFRRHLIAAEEPGCSVLQMTWSLTEGGLHVLLGGEPTDFAVPAIRGWNAEEEKEEVEEDAPKVRTRVGEKSKPKVTLRDVVLPAQVATVLKTATAHLSAGDNPLLKAGSVLCPPGRGTALLFYGPPGTGKTLTAEALAGSLGKPLLVASLPSLLSKYIGDSEKNLHSLFRQATKEKAVLLLDEADSLVARRTEVYDATDAYRNGEVNVALAEIDAFAGVVVLTTNFNQSLDPALERRLFGKVEFPLPEFPERVQIWDKMMTSLPTSGLIPLAELAEMPMSGGHIRNCVQYALRLAVAEGCQRIAARHLRQAVQQEADKLPPLQPEAGFRLDADVSQA